VKRGYKEQRDIIPGLSVCLIPGKPHIFKSELIISPKTAKKHIQDIYTVNFPDGK